MGEWERRQLCPDGACIGVIGADGKCTVCGKEGASDRWPRASASEEDDCNDAAVSDAGRSPKSEARSPSAGPSDDWDDRALCPDGACVGVIGDDGKCRVCGRSAA